MHKNLMTNVLDNNNINDYLNLVVINNELEPWLF
jgi:hypothetical protein